MIIIFPDSVAVNYPQFQEVCLYMYAYNTVKTENDTLCVSPSLGPQLVCFEVNRSSVLQLLARNFPRGPALTTTPRPCFEIKPQIEKITMLRSDSSTSQGIYKWVFSMD